ncbi:hypothetical protein EAXG_01505 [Escherichia coli TA054]|nr:hypothetical protein EAXG_01505 [Escherichia coli TA054]
MKRGQKLLIFRHRAHLRTFAHSELSRPGEPQKFCRPSEQKGTPTCRFCGGLAPHTVKPGNISRPSGDISVQARPTPLKQRSRFWELAKKKQAKRAS